jgi:hypothetical protein
MKTNQYIKFYSPDFKVVAQKTIITAVIFAFASIICVVPTTAKVGKINKRRTATRPVEPSSQAGNDLNGQNLDTIVATNKNVGNFKKGFFGDNAVSTFSNSPFYKLDVIAKTGTQGLTSITTGSTVNSSGLVSFAGGTAAGFTVFIGNTENASRIVFSPTSNPVGGTVQLTENSRIAAWTTTPSSPFVQVLALRDALQPSNSPVVATTQFGLQDNFDTLSNYLTVNRFDQPVFSAVRQNQLSLVSGFRLGYTFLKNYPAVISQTLRPMIADNGVIVIRETETGNVQRIKLYNYGLPTGSQTIADESRFNSLGASPGISDDGDIVIFQGDLKPDGSANYNDFYQTTS